MIQRIPRPVGSVAVLCFVALPLGCARTEAPSAPARPPLVEAVQVEAGALPLQETLPGVVRAENQVAIRPEISATVTEVLVRSGASVERGQALVRLRNDEWFQQERRAEADVRSSEADAAEARARRDDLETRVGRLRNLAAEDLVSPQDVESLVAQLDAARAGSMAAEARVEEARAALSESRSELARTVIRSPVSGRIGDGRVEPGMLVEPGSMLFLVGNPDRVIVEVNLDEALMQRVRVGQPVRIRTRGADAAPIEARVSRISPFLASQSFTAAAEIDVAAHAGRLLPGMFVTVDVQLGVDELATILPTSALWEDPRSGERGVFVVEDADGLVALAEPPGDNPERIRGTRFRSVEVRAEGRGQVGVDGVAAGEWVVIAGQHLLRRNMRDETTANGATVDTTGARIRPTTAERVRSLQELQSEDLLNGFLEKQQRIAGLLGAAIPENEGVVQRALATDGDSQPAVVPGSPGVR